MEHPCDLHEGGAWIYHYARHSDHARDLVLSLKYANQESLGRAMGECIGRAVLSDNEALIRSYDTENVLLVPIPLHLNSARRFNQSRAIAEGISRALGFKVSESLRWSFDVKAQTARSRRERLKLADDVFKADSKLADRKVIIVDDVLTTGTTLKRALSACASAGAECRGAIVWTRTLASKG